MFYLEFKESFLFCGKQASRVPRGLPGQCSRADAGALGVCCKRARQAHHGAVF